MQLDIDHQIPNPWFNIWIRPRTTIRHIVDTDPTRQVILLAILSGLAYTLDRAAARNMGDRLPLPVVFVIMLIMSPISGLLIIYVGGFLYRWVGSWFGGQAYVEEIRAAIAWSSVPKIWGLLLWLPQIIVFGQKLFVSFTPRIDTNPILLLLLLGFGVLELVIDGWAFVVFLNCLGEVHQFSVWKALGTFVIGILIIGIPIFVLILGLAAWTGTP